MTGAEVLNWSADIAIVLLMIALLLVIVGGVLPAGLDAYPAPFAGYNDVLARYSAWLLAQRAAGWTVIDVHGAMTAALAQRRTERRSEAIA